MGQKLCEINNVMVVQKHKSMIFTKHHRAANGQPAVIRRRILGFH
jgi:hypothetical protein